MSLRTTALLAVLFALSLGCLAVSVRAGAQTAVAQPATTVISVNNNTAVVSNDEGSGPDDDDDAELLYHWQNKKYIADERRQIAEIGVFLFLTGALAMARTRRLIHSSREASSSMGDAA